MNTSLLSVDLKWIDGVLTSRRSKMPKWNGILSPKDKADYIQRAIDYYVRLYPAESALKRSANFFNDEIILNTNNISSLLEMPQLQRITFKKVLKIIEMLLTNNTTAFIAKQIGVESAVVDFLRVYLKNSKMV